MKICSKCKQLKDYSEFVKRSERKSGYTSDCKVCRKIWADSYYLENPDKKLLKSRKYYKENSEVVRLKTSNWYNSNKNRKKLTNKIWAKENSGSKNACTRKRQALKLQRTPKWLSSKQHEQIKQIYLTAIELSKKTGIKYEVDHIVPLQGKMLNGLHVPWNLQILTREENRKKGNKYHV